MIHIFILGGIVKWLKWLSQIEKRNILIKEGKINCYYVDKNMKEEFDKMFEEPNMDEDYLLITNAK